MTEQHKPPSQIDERNKCLTVLDMRLIVTPDHEDTVHLAASDFMAEVGSLTVAEPKLTTVAYSSPLERVSTDEELRDQIVTTLESRMARARFNSKERSVGRLAMAGFTTRQMANILAHSEMPLDKLTIEDILISAQRKTGSANRAGLAAYLLGFGSQKTRERVVAQFTTEIQSPQPIQYSMELNNEKPVVTDDEITVVRDICERFMDYYGLLPKEREMAWLTMQGLSNAQIAKKVGLAEPTVKDHISGLLGILDARNRTEVTSILLGSIFKST